MRDRRSYFMCFPSVVCVGKQTPISIVPRDNSRRFREGKEYELAIIGLEDDEISYRSPIEYDCPCVVRDGCLTFTACFDSEQEYEIRFHEKGAGDQRITLYAVKEDLYSLRPLKGDFHVHTYYSDGRDGITMTPADYREEGFDFCTITDHNRRYPSVLASELYNDVKLGFHIIQGEEVHTPGSSLHIVHAGGSDSVCERYFCHEEDFQKEVETIESTLPDTVSEQYRHRFALAKWACKNIHDFGGIAIFAHPYWKPRRYNITKEFSDLLFDAKLFDAFEVFGGVFDSECNLQTALWQEQLIQGNAIPVVGSSDSHNHNATVETFGRCFTLVFAESNTTSAIIDAVRKGYCVAGSIPRGDDATGRVPYNDGAVQFFGTQFRLVKFSHFLYRSYFPETRRLSYGEGVLMRRYAEGEEVGELLSSFSDTVTNFYEKYYGLAPAPIVNARISEFLDRALELQLKGPVSNGSRLFGSTRNE